MLSKIFDEDLIKNNTRALTIKRNFLTDPEAFGCYLRHSNEFREFCANYQPELISDTAIVREVIEIESFANLVYNYVLEIYTKNGSSHSLSIYAKCYAPFAKGDPSYLFADNLKLRGMVESVALLELRELKIDQLLCPQVILYDSENQLLITLGLTCQDGITPLSPLADGNCQQLGLALSALAQLHSRTCLPTSSIASFDEQILRSILEFKGTLAFRLFERYPDFAVAWREFVEDTLAQPVCRIHGNLTPRNIMILGDSRLAFFDLEFSIHGDPAFDIGTLLGQYLLDLIVNLDPTPANCENLIRAWTVYANEQLMYKKTELEALESRIVKYIALTLLYRAWFTPSWHPMQPEMQNVLSICSVNMFTEYTLILACDSIFCTLRKLDSSEHR